MTIKAYIYLFIIILTGFFVSQYRRYYLDFNTVLSLDFIVNHWLLDGHLFTSHSLTWQVYHRQPKKVNIVKEQNNFPTTPQTSQNFYKGHIKPNNQNLLRTRSNQQRNNLEDEQHQTHVEHTTHKLRNYIYPWDPQGVGTYHKSIRI